MTTRREFLLRSATAGLAAIFRPLAAASKVTDVNRRSRDAGIAQTVLGPLDTSKLGFTLPHEHVAEGAYYLSKWPKAWGGRTEFVAKAVEKLKVIKAAGISTIVDLTPYDVWRDIRFLEEISRKSRINMIASTGQRFFPPVTHVPMPARTIAGLTEFFRREIEQGIDGTHIKAGVIKIGIVGKNATPLEETGLRAAARASKATGIPTRIHTDAANRAGENLAAILEDEGMNPAKVSFDHSDDSGDMDYFLGLVRRGYSSAWTTFIVASRRISSHPLTAAPSASNSSLTPASLTKSLCQPIQNSEVRSFRRKQRNGETKLILQMECFSSFAG